MTHGRNLVPGVMYGMLVIYGSVPAALSRRGRETKVLFLCCRYVREGEHREREYLSSMTLPFLTPDLLDSSQCMNN